MEGSGGLRPNVVHWLYVAIIWLSISFASLVWWPDCQMASAKKGLSRVQKTCMLRDNRSDTYHSYLVWRVDVMRPVFNLEPKYRVTVLTREEWTRGPGTHPIVKGFVWFTNGSRMAEGTGAGVFFGNL